MRRTNGSVGVGLEERAVLVAVLGASSEMKEDRIGTALQDGVLQTKQLQENDRQSIGIHWWTNPEVDSLQPGWQRKEKRRSARRSKKTLGEMEGDVTNLVLDPLAWRELALGKVLTIKRDLKVQVPIPVVHLQTARWPKS
jgi:hypothetical protein